MRRTEPNIKPLGIAAAAEAELLPGHFSALFRRIGAPQDPTATFCPPLPPGGIRDGQELFHFLEGYQRRIMTDLEMPAIVRAHFHTARGRSRELLALDQEIAGEPLPPPLASASRRIGRAQLERLRPLRDERMVQRYLAAVESGQAQGWHTVVYGLTLAVYSWPLRSGLLAYARETLQGLAHAAGRSAALSEAVCQETLLSLLPLLPATIEQTLTRCEGLGEVEK
jgi:urease accessory protein UreF